jgi:gliding motility-associated protein GldM
MAGVNETPRQKMMGILYLVLLGLAATTITQQVLDSFRNLSVGLEASTTNVQSTIDRTFASFQAGALKDDPVRNQPIWSRAQAVKAAVDDLDKTIKSIKAEFEKECGGFDEAQGDYKQREDVDISPRIMIVHHRADELKKKIEETKAKILAQLTPEDRASFKMALNADDPNKKAGETKKSWEQSFFGDGIPLTAAFTALTKIEADLRNTESDAVKKILGETSKTDLVLDQYAALAVPTSSSYVLVGQPYTAEVFLTAFSNSLNPEIMVGGQKLNVTGGKGLYTVNTSREGEFKWSATLRMKKADGTMGEWKTPEVAYRVAKPSAVVSPDKMNVFYIGLDNPVSVSAPGIAAEKIKVQMSSGSIKSAGAPGKYIVNVTQSGTIKVTIFGEDEKGKSTQLGQSEFRCKRVPTPKAKFAGKSGGNVPRAQLTAADKVFAALEDFDFNTTFNINHFKLYVAKPRQDAQIMETSNNMLTAPMKAALAGCTAGTKVYFDEIFATGPDGIKRPLDPIIFTIQ